MSTPHHPSLYQINTRVWLEQFNGAAERRATFDDIPDAELDRLAAMGFDWVWFLSVWETGEESRVISRAHSEWRADFQRTLPDLCEDDIIGSGFAIAGYTVAKSLGGDAALARLRERMRKRGLKLMLDFVPNHMGLDHPWITAHPEFFVSGTESDLARTPQNYRRFASPGGERIIAYGRDPYFDGWPDTVQLNYGNPATQAAMRAELLRIAGQCDGVRCDMAMLLLPEVFARTWGINAEPFWPSTIQSVKSASPGFCFLAEVYWDLEWTLQSQGFDYCYDKRLYDRLHAGPVRPIREHFFASLDYQAKLARFLENHDEPRAAVTFPGTRQHAAATITYLAPGMRFFHDGQFEGRRTRISPHLGRAPREIPSEDLQSFYRRLLETLRAPIARSGRWSLLESQPAWDGNSSNEAFISFLWENNGEHLLVAVNYAPHSSQCYIPLPIPDLSTGRWRFADTLTRADYTYSGSDLHQRGLYLDVPPWHAHAFRVLRTG